MDALVKDLEEEFTTVRQGGGPKVAERMRSKGKNSAPSGELTVHARLALLLDPHMPCLELSQLAARDGYGESVSGAGLITGIGRTSGRECMVVVSDATVKGGSYYPLTVKKQLRAQEITREHGLPCVYVGFPG
ncbi:ClpP/crotonase-like domain-containing protein [Ganoderma leucocontextum]|nr:ClpP/crotonase-like domain-containing protein [Ganoderma leucocontextum]